MARRHFLKLLSLAFAGIAAHFSLPWVAAASVTPVSYAGQLWRAGGRGKIQVSTNGGTSWKLQTNLGNIYSIKGLAVDGSNRLRATIGYAGRTFNLYLAPDLKRWRTV